MLVTCATSFVVFGFVETTGFTSQIGVIQCFFFMSAVSRPGGVACSICWISYSIFRARFGVRNFCYLENRETICLCDPSGC